MLPVGPSVDNGYRGSRDNAIRGDHENQGGFWDPLVRGYGPINVFNEEEINAPAYLTVQTRRRPKSNNGRNNDNNKNSNNNSSNNNKNNDNNNNNYGDDRRDDHQQGKRQSNRRISRQQRGSRWSQSTAERKFRDQSKMFDRGHSKYKEENSPSTADLISYVAKKSNKKRTKGNKHNLEATAAEISNSKSTAGQRVRELVRAYMTDGKYGNLPKEKPDDCIRLFLGQFNSLGIFTGMKKVQHLNNVFRDFSVDVMGGCETQADWRFVTEEHQFGNLFGKGKKVRSVAANNTAEPKMKRDQRGGTGLCAMGRVAAFVKDTPKDPSNLGRFCSMLLAGGGKKTRIVIIYVPGDPGRNSKGETVWDQHSRVWEKKGDLRSPGVILFEQIISQLLIWKADREEIILMGDFNENVYTGMYAERLSRPDLNMTEQCLKTTKRHLPATFIRGTQPIDAIYATAGVVCVNACLLPNKIELGDHRGFLLDFTSASVIGENFPNVMPASARKLHCESERLIANYNRVLDQLCDRNNMYRRITAIYKNADYLSNSDFLLLMNKWDDELTDHMTSAEKKCNVFKHCHIEWSPEVGIWLQRRWLLGRVLLFVKGRVPDPRNLIRDCKTHNVEDLSRISPAVLHLEIHVCNLKIKDLHKTAPQLRREHLTSRIREAEARGDSKGKQAIINIIRKESKRKRWRRVNRTTKEPRGGQVLSVRVQVGDATERHDTEDGIFGAVSNHLAERFRLAFSAPCMSGQLFDDIGFIGDTECAQQILEGTYVFPPGTDPATQFLLEEAGITYQKMSKEEVAMYVSTEDFQDYWQTANERISSSASGLHFGHYKAASFDRVLSSMHAAKLSACARKGLPLARWGRAVTVLLEKICGYNYVHKLRAICLLEADFNWWNKLVFAKRMMANARAGDMIPEENFAKKGSSCNDAVMTKRMFTDNSRMLHHPAGVGGSDWGDCYDRAAHPAAALAFRSWGISQAGCRVLLMALRTMHYCLRTGFGESKEMYGGTEENPFQGYGQGNCASPPGFSALSALVVNAYRRMGHGAKLTSAYSSRLFLLAAVMYVDDTDLLHWARSPSTRGDELIQQVQGSTNDWGLLGQATGGALKPEKCFLYLLDYAFPNGRARLKSLKQLPEAEFKAEVKGKGLQPAHITVPQPDGSNAPIHTVDVFEPTKMLGIFFAPAGDSTEHVEEMCQKGHDWVDRVTARPLQTSDAWLSFMYQLFPGMSWGLVTTVIAPGKLNDLLHKVYYKALPLLGIRRTMRREYRTLPERFQGLGLPDFVVLALATKIFFLQSHWGFKGATAEIVMSTFETFMLEVGMYGNIFSCDYERFGPLTTDNTWYQNFWQYCHHLDVDFRLDPKFLLGPARMNDRPLTELFDEHGFRGLELESLTIFRHYKCVVHLSDILCCDGKTLDPRILEFTPGASKYVFPHQRPRQDDWRLWQRAVLLVTSSFRSTRPPLGRFLTEPHAHNQWWISETDTQLCRRVLAPDNDTLGWAIFDKQDSQRYSLRSGSRFRWTHSKQVKPPWLRYASVTTITDDIVALHSSAPPPILTLPSYDFWSVLRSFDNQSLWDNFDCDGDGSWLTNGMANGTLVAVHDGSYMREVEPNACSAAYMIRCNATGLRAKGSVAEWSESADNYRAEILGGIMTQLVLRAASCDPTLAFKEVTVDCDNKGVVLHGNSAWRPLKEKQAQADVLRCFKQLINEQHAEIKMEWVPSHQDDEKSWTKCTLKEKINIKVDRLAKTALLSAIQHNEYIESGFPGEHITVVADGMKVTGSLKLAIERSHGSKVAQQLYDEESILARNDFHLVWWDGVGAVMRRYPKQFRNWVTKQVSGAGGTNHELAKIDTTVLDVCPNCNYTPETTKHMTRCRHDGRRTLFLSSAAAVLDCLATTEPDPELMDMMDTYISSQGDVTLSACLPHVHSKFSFLAAAHDSLGWDNFMEGRISKLWLETITPFLKQASRKSPQQWGRNFIDCLLSLTHKQWIFRNTKVHFKTEGLTEAQHEALAKRIKELITTQPANLLAKDQYLLAEDFHRLGEGPAASRQLWVASMESALGAAAKFAAGKLVPGSHPYLHAANRHLPRRFSSRAHRQTKTHSSNTSSNITATTQRNNAEHSTNTTFTSSMQRHLEAVRLRRTTLRAKPCGDIRRTRRDTGSCIYRKDWSIK